MPQRTRRAALSKRRTTGCANSAKDAASSLPRASGGPGQACAGGESMGRRAIIVLVLTTALIFFMSRKDVDHARSRSAPEGRPASAQQVFEQWPSSALLSPGMDAIDRSSRAHRLAPRTGGRDPLSVGTAYHPGYSHAGFAPARYEYERDRRSSNLIYARAIFFGRRYDSRPYWNGRKLEMGVATDRATADLAIEHLIPCESMGRTINRIDSNGKMSYGILQFQDWNEWEAASGLGGNPDNRADAIRMAEWAIENGMINHWTCAQILRMM
jgi:hypothetical protein